ncbi:MAG: alpha/beta fold hydrolase [Actinocrinis sp.]
MDLPRCAGRVDLAPAGVKRPVAALDARPDGEPRATILMVPGFTGSKEDFLHLLEPLAEAGVRTVAIDQSGQCDTRGVDDTAAYAVAGPGGGSIFATDIRALVADLAAQDTGPVHVLGHSFGGHAVREALVGAESPLPLASLTLLDAGPAAVVGQSSVERLKLLLSIETELTLGQVHELSPVDRHSDPAVRDFLLHRWLSNEPASLFGMARRLLGEQDWTGDLKAQLDAWNLPCLVVAGEGEDVWPSPLISEMADRLGARYVEIADAGHSPNTDQPAALVKVLADFWLS